MYRVEVFSTEHNDYVLHSWYTNREWAEIQADIQVLGGKNVKVIYDGKVVLWYRNGKKIIGKTKNKEK